MAAPAIEHLGNKRNDSQVTQELALAIPKTSNKKPTLRLEDAQLKRKELAQNADDLLNCAREANLKYIDEIEANIASMQMDIHSLREKNAMHLDQLKEKDNYLGMLKQQIEDLNCAREQNLKDVDELRANNECLQKEVISLEEKNFVYMEQLKKKDNYLETLKQEFEDIGSERATILGCGNEQQINSRMGKEMNFITEGNTLYREQLKEKDSCIEALKQQIEDMNSVYKTNLICIKQLHGQNKCCESLKYEKEPKSQEYGVLGEQVVCSNTQVPADLSVLTRSLSYKSQEIEFCRNMILKEVSALKPDYDVESQSKSQLTDLLKILLTCVMEKGMEVCHSLQHQMNEIHAETEKEYVKKDKQKESWIRELKAEIEYLQAYVARVEVEKKALEHSLNVSDFMSQRSELTVAEPDENLLLKKELEEKLEKQKELSRENENLATCITGLKEEVSSLRNENVRLREAVKILNAEKSSLHVLMCIKESNIEGFKRQLEKLVHEKATLFAACKCIQEPMQQPKDALIHENKGNSSSVSENGNYTEHLHLRHPFSARVANSMTEKCGTDVSEKRILEDQLKICKEEKMAVTNENERLVADISDLQKKLERYYVEKNSLEISLETLEEEKKRLESHLSVSHKRLLDAEREVQELKLKTVAKRNDEAAQENIFLRFRIKKLEAEVELHKIRKHPLSKESHSAGHNTCKRGALCCHVQSQLTETASVLKSSAATNTDISDVSEKRILEDQLKICKEEKMAVTNENERLVADISDLQKKLERYYVEKNSLETSLETLEEGKKRLESHLSVPHKRLLDAEREVQELKLKTVSKRNDEAAQENVFLRYRIKKLEAEFELHKIRKHPLSKESHSAGHNTCKRGALCCHVQSQLTETASVLKSSAATNTDISDVSEKRILEDQLKICKEEKMAVTNENERLVADISDLQKKLERYYVEKNSLETSLETLEEGKKRLESHLSVSHKRLLDAEREVQELKLKTVSKRNDEAAQENVFLRYRIKKLEAEFELHKIRKHPLSKESHSAGHNTCKRGALCCHVQSQLTETASVLKSSAVTNTDISGSCQCRELTEKGEELKIINEQLRKQIGYKNLLIRPEELPYRRKVQEMGEGITFYKSKNKCLKAKLCNVTTDSGCDSSGKPMLLQARHIAVHTDNITDEVEVE